jgi:hypothetical protein
MARTLNRTLTTSFPEFNGFIEIDSITLALPAQSGTSSFTAFSGGAASTGTSNVIGHACPVPPIPVPTTAVPEGQTVGGSVGAGLP